MVLNRIHSECWLLLLLLHNRLIVAYHEDTRHVAKRHVDMDLCLERIDVRLFTILRTGESKAMGAIFLDDHDVKTRTDCSRKCCENSECDVYIFEEKSPGTCFLFHCGLPDDFRCKFQSHGNYSSGFLIMTRKEMELQGTLAPIIAANPQMSQHELELTSLKKPSRGSTTSTTTLEPFDGQPGLVASTSTQAPKSLLPACGRFQFQCHSGECIAVYNACDGIPQCEDSSDEGPECPATGNVIKPIQTVVKEEQAPKMEVFPPQNNAPYFPKPPQHNREDPNTAPKWPQSHVTLYSNTDTDSHIFNHKGGLQVASNNFPPQQFPPNYQIHDPYLMSQQNQQPQWPPNRNEWPQMVHQQQQQEYLAAQQPPQIPVAKTVDQQPTPSEPKKTKDYDEEQYTEEQDFEQELNDVKVTTEAAPKKKQRKHKKHKDKSKQHPKALPAQQFELVDGEDDTSLHMIDHDGRSDRPSGAVVSLTLGSILTVILAVFIGCRMRRVRRFSRHRNGKGGKYEHDADFLVNGMYL